jgi:hypothetical protein
MPDPIRELQRAAALAAKHLGARDRAVRVAVWCSDGVRVIDAAVPPDALEADPGERPPPAIVPGWSFVNDRVVLYDGRAVAVSPSRVRLLRVLVEAEGKLSAKELARLAFDREADEENARYHVKALRAELKDAFRDFEGEIVPGDGGYRIALR